MNDPVAAPPPVAPAPPAAAETRPMPAAVVWSLAAGLVVLLVISGLPAMFVWVVVGLVLVGVGPVVGLGLMIAAGVLRARTRRRLGSGESVGSRPVDDRVAGNAENFRAWRQIVLLLAHAVVAAVTPIGVALMLGWRDDGGSATFLYLTSIAALGLLILVMAPFWMFSRSTLVGEERSLLSRTGAWRLVLAHRVLAWIVGALYSAAALVVLAGNVVGSLAFGDYL